MHLTSTELTWAAAHLGAFGDRLSRFVAERDRFHNAVLGSDVDAAADALKTIQRECGSSIWTVKATIALSQLTHGLQEQKRFAKTIWNNPNVNHLLRYLAFHTSVRNEPAVLLPRFRSELESSVGAVGGELGTYLRYHLAPDLPSTPLGLASVLCRESAGTAVDYYEATLYALTRAMIDYASDSEVLDSALDLLDRVEDTKLLSIAALLANDSEGITAAMGRSEAVEDLLNGRYGRAVAAFDLALAANPADGDAFFGVARGLASAQIDSTTDKPVLAQTLAYQVGRLLSGDKEQQNEPLRHALNFYGSHVSAAIIALQGSDQGLSHASDRNVAVMAACLSPSRLPLWAQLLPPGQFRDRYVDALLGAWPGPAAQQFGSGFRGVPPDSLFPAEADLITASQLYEQGRFEQSELAAQRLLSQPDPFHQRRGARRECLALLGLGKRREAVTRLVGHYLNHPEFVDVLPLRDVVAVNKGTKRGPLFATPAWAICLELHRQFVDAATDPLFAVIGFLDSAGAAKPADLARAKDSFDPLELTYFLRFLCVESLMDRAGRFETSKAALEGRLEVCRLLLQLDPIQPETYHTEIKDLARQLMVRRRMREVEQSKIYIDIDSVRSARHRQDVDLFSRFHALKPTPLVARQLAKIEELARRLEVDLQSRVKLAVPPDEALDLFRGLVQHTRSEYLSSSEHGLNSYLSVRIRHGTLTAHLRKPLEDSRLVTLKQTGGSYAPNEAWLDRVPDSEMERGELSSTLDRFAVRVDEWLDEVKSWLHIEMDGAHGGLFRFDISPTELRDCYYSVLEEEPLSFDALIDRVVGILNTHLDGSLTCVRAALQDTARPKAMRMLDELEQSVEAYRFENATDLVTAIRKTRTELQFAIARVSEWFRRSVTVSSEPFSIEDLIAVGLECAQVLAPDFVASVTYSGEQRALLSGRQLNPLVDVLFTVFENIVHHSQLKHPSAEVHVALRAGGELAIRVDNPVGQGVANDAALERVAKIRGELNDVGSARAVTREGGTGLHKLTRILQHELGASPKVTFGFIKRDQFSVEFSTMVRLEVA